MIILNEHDAAVKDLENHVLGRKPFEMLKRIARYYIDNGYNKKQVRKLLDDFVLRCNASASLPKWANTLDSAVAVAMTRPAVQIDHITISKNEMTTINTINGVQTRRLAFTLLCLSKYWNIVSGSKDNWVNSKDSDIMRMANINTSIKRQGAMFHALFALGYIRFSKVVDNTNVQVCFVEEGETALVIDDFRNLGYQYLKYCGQPFKACDNCGALIRLKSHIGRPRKYCSACAHEMYLAQHRDAGNTYRHKKC